MIADKLTHYFPSAQWNMTGETYASLEWFGPGDMPTEAEIDALAWPPGPTQDDFRHAVQSHIDAIAQSRQYDSGVSLASYRNDPNQAWADEAAAFIAWRSDVWAFVFEWLEAVEAGTQDPPESVDALIDAIPEMEWPE